MNVVAIIPARYDSSRFPGKPLADICGKPMIWWVYNQVSKVESIQATYVATDDQRIMDVCESLGIHALMTSKTHKTSTERAYEIANSIDADLYIVVNGDEPLISPDVISQIIPNFIPEGIYVGNLMTKINRPSEAVDFTNIKVVTNEDNDALFFSRSPIPYPKATLNYEYYKHVGVLIYNYPALEFFSKTSEGKNEKVEDVNELRFIDHGIKIHMKEVDAHSLSVDMPKDLEKVRMIISKKIKSGEISIGRSFCE